ncbi:Dedicator of cytokinesis protein 4 [Holothuria leucospilota]|uniref:Dedicator of cytokinesis protein 4 n=1 Tax=Holothuria leucospilota TaxID=206669 RepID=A0A9Q1CNC7_HOLLE|nr:Dedicator of cytokinesis protein 4 [Holothuria leucospilota]
MWQKVTGKKFGIVVCNFKSGIPHSLALTVGDRVHIKQENGNWYYGHISTDCSAMGLFPASHIHLVAVPPTDRTAQSQPYIETPILEEVVVVLKEWAEIIRGLYANPAFQSQKLPDMRGVFKKLADLRRDILSNQLTVQHQKDAKHSLVRLIAEGNKNLIKYFESIRKESADGISHPLIGLTPTVDGDVVDTESCSIVQLYKIHTDCAKEQSPKDVWTLPRPTSKIEQGQLSLSPPPTKSSRRSAEVPAIYNVHFHLLHFACGVQDNAEVYFALYDGLKKEFISERFLCRFNAHGTPQDTDLIGNIMAVFTDLSLEDLNRELYLTCHIIQKGVKDKKNSSPMVRKPYGCGVDALQELINNVKLDSSDQDKRTCKMKINSPVEHEFYQQHEMIIRTPEKAGRQVPENIGIDYKVQVLQGQFESLIFKRKVPRVRKLGFSEIINPDDQRNDLYVTLEGAKIDKINKPVEVVVAAIDGSGKKIKCICFADSETFQEQYESYISSGGNLMKWNENIKFRMPTTAFSEKENMHIRFEFRTISSKQSKKKLFAIAFIRLTKDDDTTVEDAEHTLFIYKCPDGTELNPNQYINFPASELELSHRSSYASGGSSFTLSQRDSVTVHTLVCSTKLTSNGHVVQLLKWRTNMNKLEHVVNNIQRVPGEDIVVVLSDILDSLFEILDLKKAHLEKPVFRTLVYIINTLNDQRYKSFTSVLDNYLNGQFSSSTLHFFLLSHLTENINRASDEVDFVRDMLLGLQHFFKLIFMSHTNLQSTTVVDQLDIVEKIRDLIDALNKLMSSKHQPLEDLQLIVLQNAVAMYSEMMNMEIYNADEVCQFTVDILESINTKQLSPKLLLAKLNCIIDTVRSPLFQNMSARRVFVRPIVPQLKQHLYHQESVEQCVDILSEMVSLLQSIANEKAMEGDAEKGRDEIDEDIGLISREILENLLDIMNNRMNSQESNKQQEATRTMTCLLTLLSIMQKKHYDDYRKIFPDVAAKQTFLSKVLIGFTSACYTGIFLEKRWVVMNMVCNRVLLRAVKYFCSDLPLSISDGRPLELWREFFKLTATFITQQCLRLEEKYTKAKREQLKKKFGDLRLEMAELMATKWNSLGEHQVKLANDDMIRLFLDVSLVPEAKIRRVVLPLLFDIMKWEWQHEKDLSQLEMVLIDSVDDKVCRDRKGDELYARTFREIMMEKLQGEPWERQGQELVSKVTMLFERLIDYRLSQQQGDNRYLRLSATHSLICFYKDMVVREHIYKRHILSLKNIHLEVDDYYEAACTLQLQAKMLNWGENKKDNELKEMLYGEILEILDKGKVWEPGVEILKELEQQYEYTFFDYPKVSEVLKRRAEFFEKISTSVRQEPVYFKIDFYGSFPHVRSISKDKKSFIFKGAPFDKIDSMLEKLQSDFPKAKLWSKPDPPTESQLADNEQYIEIRAVEPVPPQDSYFVGREEVPREILHYYKHYMIREFKYDKPFHRGEKDKSNEFKTLWLERTIMTTAEELPHLLVWSEIVNIQRYELTPLEKQTEDIESKIQDISNASKYYRSHQNDNLNPFTQVLQGTIDAAVMGGLSKVRECFLSDEYAKEHPDDAEKLENLKELINRQLSVLDEALALHGTLISSELTDLQDLLEKRMKEEFQKAGLTTHSRRVSQMGQSPGGRPRISRTSTGGQGSPFPRTLSQFYVSVPDSAGSSGISPRRQRATVARTGLELESSTEPSTPRSSIGSSSRETSTIAEEPAETSSDQQTQSQETRDSGIGNSSSLLDLDEIPTNSPPVLPPRPRPTSTSSTSSHGSSNFSSSGNSSRPASSESEQVQEEPRPGPPTPWRVALQQARSSTTTDYATLLRRYEWGHLKRKRPLTLSTAPTSQDEQV